MKYTSILLLDCNELGMKQCLSNPEQCKPVTRNFLLSSDDGWCKNNCVHGNLLICQRNCKCAEKGKRIMLDIRLFASFK